MIRSNVPLPVLYRLGMRASWMARRAQSKLSSYRHRGQSEVSRISGARKAAPRRGAVDCSPQLWAEFIGHYESFTGALCSAAKNGCTAADERMYTDARCWLARHYASIAHRVRPYLDVEFNSDPLPVDTVSVIVDYAGQKREIDVLEELFIYPTLGEMIHHDGGDLIPRIARISNAVYRCHECHEHSSRAID